VPLSFSDDALQVLMRLAEPIDRELRDPFLRAVATELRGHEGEVVDSGLAYRTGRALQREFLPGFVAPSRLVRWKYR
jgi:hypothetical protein